MDNVAVARGIAGSRGLRKARLRFLEFDRYRAAGFVYRRDWSDGGREDAVAAGGWRILKSPSDGRVDARSAIEALRCEMQSSSWCSAL
jgi:hypothetical protein